MPEQVVLNGLPRHVGQVTWLADLVEIDRLLVLDCPPAVVAARVARRAAGASEDEAGRNDDRPEQVAEKIVLFERQTLPLVEHYRQQGVPVRRLPVAVTTTAADLAAELAGGCW
jgi:adenylate kinase family enzyme